MPLAEMLEKLYSRRRFGIRPGVERIQLLLQRLGNPHLKFQSLHVVGTNGKGSTAAFLSSILTASGLRTGLFTSPHLVCFNERLRIDGHDVTDQELAPLVCRVLDVAPDEATFFEIVTAIGALYFSENKIDLAVIEAGMGGKSDATAAFDGCMTLITPISLDHCDYLGATLQEIAKEKAGIARSGRPVIINHQEIAVRQALLTHFASINTQPVWLDNSVTARWNGDGSIAYTGLATSLDAIVPGIPGRYQIRNATLALAAAETLNRCGFSISDAAMFVGIKSAHWPGRMEMIPGSPPLLLDGAHNPAGASALAESLSAFDYRKLILVIGVMADKDIFEMLSQLAPLASLCYCVMPDIERAMSDTLLAEKLDDLGIQAIASGSVAAGIETARTTASENDLILVCGSLFTVGEAKAWLSGKHFEGIRG